MRAALFKLAVYARLQGEQTVGHQSGTNVACHSLIFTVVEL